MDLRYIRDRVAPMWDTPTLSFRDIDSMRLKSDVVHHEDVGRRLLYHERYILSPRLFFQKSYCCENEDCNIYGDIMDRVAPM